MTTAKGIDVSSWQHPSGAAIDWEQVKASGVTFVMVKATQGTDYTNPYANGPLAHDITDALAAGLLVGAYHFARPGPDTAEAEAAYFLAAVEGLKLDMGLWLDLEDLGGKMPHEVVPYRDVFLTAIVTHNALSGIYTDKSLVAQGLGAPAGSRLWLANPTPEPGDPESFITQTGSGLVDGVTGSVDLDTLNNVRPVNPDPIVTPPAPPAPAPVPMPPAPSAPAPAPQPLGGDVQVPTLSEVVPGPSVESGAVKAVQALLLGKEGETVGPAGIDGRFGNQTAMAVGRYQAAHGLKQDKVVGPITWESLCTG